MDLGSDDKRLELTIEVLLTAYNRCGEEILSHQKLQIQSLQIGILAIIALLGYISTSREYMLTAYIPIIIVMFTHVFLHFDNQMILCGVYNLEIENMINQILNCENQKIMNWENRFGGLVRGISKEFAVSTKIFALLIAGIYMIFSFIGVLSTFDGYGIVWAFLLGLLYITLCGLEIQYLLYLLALRKPYQNF